MSFSFCNPAWRGRVVSLAAAAVGLTAAASPAVTVTLNPVKDAMIFGTSATVDTGNASGHGPALFAGADGSSNKKRSLVQFDFVNAVIPVGRP